MYDLLIKNGTIFDGSGGPGYPGGHRGATSPDSGGRHPGRGRGGDY